MVPGLPGVLVLVIAYVTPFVHTAGLGGAAIICKVLIINILLHIDDRCQSI